MATKRSASVQGGSSPKKVRRLERIHNSAVGQVGGVDDEQQRRASPNDNITSVAVPSSTITKPKPANAKQRKEREASTLPSGHDLLRLLQVGEYDDPTGRPNHQTVADEYATSRNNVLQMMKKTLKKIYGDQQGLTYIELYKNANKATTRRSPWTKGLTAKQIREQKKLMGQSLKPQKSKNDDDEEDQDDEEEDEEKSEKEDQDIDMRRQGQDDNEEEEEQEEASEKQNKEEDHQDDDAEGDHDDSDGDDEDEDEQSEAESNENDADVYVDEKNVVIAPADAGQWKDRTRATTRSNARKEPANNTARKRPANDTARKRPAKKTVNESKINNAASTAAFSNSTIVNNTVNAGNADDEGRASNHGSVVTETSYYFHPLTPAVADRLVYGTRDIIQSPVWKSMEDTNDEQDTINANTIVVTNTSSTAAATATITRDRFPQDPQQVEEERWIWDVEALGRGEYAGKPSEHELFEDFLNVSRPPGSDHPYPSWFDDQFLAFIRSENEREWQIEHGLRLPDA